MGDFPRRSSRDPPKLYWLVMAKVEEKRDKFMAHGSAGLSFVGRSKGPTTATESVGRLTKIGLATLKRKQAGG